jgi:hypothetical protein
VPVAARLAVVLVFLSHDDIFIARQWRRRWSMHMAMEVTVVCAVPMAAWPVLKALAGHSSPMH